jgi:hypothetical protein
MRALAAGQAVWHRIKRPATWGAVLLFGAVWALARWAMGFPGRTPEDLLGPFLWALLFLAITPFPWQWTGNDAPLARPWRGLLQAVPWNAAWVLALLLLLSGGAPRPGLGRGPGMMGRGMRMMPPPEDRPWLPLHPRVLLLAITNLSICVLLGWILADKERAEAVAREARRTAAQAQARALQAQMNPHVLFNAISGLTELVREDPEAAERALVSLADLLRGLLEHGARAAVPLSLERELVERYLALEQIRLGRRLQVAWHWDRGLESAEVPPLLVQPLVENALKHGIAPSRTGGEVCIGLRAEDGDLALEVANTGLALQDGAPEGVGVHNLRERLGLLGLPDSAFSLVRDGDWTRARIRLPRPGGRP